MSRRSGTGQQRGIQGTSAINKNAKGRRHILSAEAQSVLSTILEDIIENTLEDARKMAETAGKTRVSIEEIERALKILCQRFHSARHSNRIVNSPNSSLNRKPRNNNF
ncbi:hypothetical protein PV325_007307 [Microctonus aethiopoides]|nr:hypothetical protein PV325_007307 [Microctonus aethiopoides]KAK0075804.1 hypothetical protein PV326_011263 [Microctonus aethiopoides]